jgi:hypothetical protein
MRQKTIKFALLVLFGLLATLVPATATEDRSNVTGFADSVAVQFIGATELWLDAPTTDWLRAADLDTMGWRMLLPVELADTCTIRRTTAPEIYAFGIIEHSSPPSGPGQWENGRPITISVHAFIHEESNTPLFALAYDNLADAQSVVPVGYEQVRELLDEHSPVHLTSECDQPISPYCGLAPTIGYLGPGRIRSELADADLAVFHRIGIEISGEQGCAWIIGSYSLENTTSIRDTAACIGRLEVIDGTSNLQQRGTELNGAGFLSWDGFPEHPENIQVMENLEERFREYQQQRQQWLNEREQKKE